MSVKGGSLRKLWSRDRSGFKNLFTRLVPHPCQSVALSHASVTQLRQRKLKITIHNKSTAEKLEVQHKCEQMHLRYLVPRQCSSDF